jgi:hypothetical protein
LLNSWLAKGDMGAGEEPEGELKYQADGHKWGSGVNPEYEAVRKDSDGDGLSDQWEQINGRDSHDGRLVFTFDCGGWQTEGWQPHGIQDNIAGYLGYLDFSLDSGAGAIQRDNLSLAATADDKALVVQLRTSEDLRVQLFANGKRLGPAKNVSAGRDFASLRIQLTDQPNWQHKIESLKMEFVATRDAFIEIDAVTVER